MSKQPLGLSRMSLFAMLIALALTPALSAQEKKEEKKGPTPLAVAEVKHEGPVDFQKDILPILRRNCLACHNATDAESDLVLETPATILKGGSEGPAAVAGKSADSLFFKLASHQMDPAMPPEDNEVGAKNLTPEQLGLLKLWVDQGAKGEVTNIAGPIQWQPLPASVNPVYALAISPHGEYVAAGRANQVFIYGVPTKSLITRLTDPALLQQGVYKNPGVADLDLIQSLAFSPDGKWLASGGYRTVKLWQRPANPQKLKLEGIEGEPQSLAVSPDGKWAAVGEASGKVKLFDLATGKVSKTFDGHAGPVTGVAFSSDSTMLATGSQDKSFRAFQIPEGKELGKKVETPAPVNAVAFVMENKQIATGHADNKIATWFLPGTEPAPAEAPKEGEQPAPPKPIKEFAGHGGPISSLVAVAAGAQLLSGSQDGTLRLWDANGGTQVRQYSHGAPVVSIAINSTGTRIASAANNNSAKLFQFDNGQQLAEIKGDHRTKLKQDDATRAVTLAKRHVDNAKKDLDDANARKKSEEENAKKAEESKTKTLAEMNQKIEAAKKPVADKEAADKELAEAKPAAEQAQVAKTKADEDAKKTEEAQQAGQKKRDDTAKAATDADTVAKDAAKKLQQAQEVAKAAATKLEQATAAAKDKPDDAALAEAVKTAEKEKTAADEAVKAAEKVKTDADAALVTANTAKDVAQKEYDDLKAKNEAAQKAKAEATQKFNEANQKLQQADNKAKQAAGPAQKATDEMNAAKRAYEAAERSVTRSAESIKKATEAIPVYEAAHNKRTEEHKAREAEKTQVDPTVAASDKPMFAVAFSPDGAMLLTGGENTFVHLWSAENGQPLEVCEGQAGPITSLASISTGGVLALSKNSTGIVWDAAPEWKLVRTIGAPDANSPLIDRVTALHFSADSQFLATGGGEPSRSGELKIWKVEDGSLVREIKDAHSDTIFDLEFSPDGLQIASCAADRFAKIHEVATGKFVRAFEGHTHHVMGVTWRCDGRVLATSGADKAIKIWDAVTGDQMKTVADNRKEVTAIKFVGVSDSMVASSGDQQVNMRDSNGGNQGGFNGTADFMYTVRASLNGQIFAAGGQDSIVRVWNNQRQPIVTFEPPKPETPAEDKQAAK